MRSVGNVTYFEVVVVFLFTIGCSNRKIATAAFLSGVEALIRAVLSSSVHLVLFSVPLLKVDAADVGICVSLFDAQLSNDRVEILVREIFLFFSINDSIDGSTPQWCILKETLIAHNVSEAKKLKWTEFFSGCGGS
jgi:hypothetical protein